MRAYINQDAAREWANTNCFAAADGFRQMGWEIVPFHHFRELPNTEPEDIVVSHIDHVEGALRTLGCTVPPALDYPEQLQPFLGRRMWQSTINEVAADPAQWPVFVKPMLARKKFTGVLVRHFRDLAGCGDQAENTPVWCAEPVHFVAEWRCFVRYGQVLAAQPYRGDWRAHFDPRVVEAAVAAYTEAPKAYALDVGITNAGATLVIEVNEGYSVGSYGLPPLRYAKFLSARWAELTGTVDACDL
ncbi:ATP-grasp domain-containing protein [Hymenobacter cellulosivorans]|uniref:ATP-grasp domain-containing protein n=1 Tax=Hymenobacter cellulosivorans TaxID=2932249 RepID=A0ABY4F7G8_9BACT|nr:ATP-grasp domain-containing protein [Hymenobacter cellulosivorans]UOQ52515.1 ATP-grasp domain-containing protein [Hymenobacter cellulosivorans]